MAWRALTVADIKKKLSGGEYENVEAQLTETGVTVQSVIDSATDYIRGFVAANPDNTLGPVGTIPSRLIDSAVAYIIPELYGHTVGMMLDQDDVRTKAAARADKVFNAVANKKFAIDEPETASTEEEADSSGDCEFTEPSTNPPTSADYAGL